MEEAADIFRSKDDDEVVCAVCGNPLEPWEQEVRLGSRMCNYHAHQVDKDEDEQNKQARPAPVRASRKKRRK